MVVCLNFTVTMEHNIIKNPNWYEANQLAIYKRGRYIYTRNLLSFTSFLIAGSVMLRALVIVLSSCCLHKLRFVRGDHCFSIHFCWKGSTSKSTSVSTEDFLAQRGTSPQTGEIFILFTFLSFKQSRRFFFYGSLCKPLPHHW